MVKLLFAQLHNGSYECIVDGFSIDECEMNYDRGVTQAHIVLASVYHTLGSKKVRVSIETLTPETAYPIEVIEDMAESLMDDDFNPLYYASGVQIYHGIN